MNELQGYASQYSREFDEILLLFEEVNCNKAKLKEVLEGKSFAKWSELEDLALQETDHTSRQYEFLIKTKGEEEVQRRKVFLGIA